MPVVASENAILLEKLRTAYVSESNGHARYQEFATKADAEGWHGVACLFRAAAIAEQIHADNHGRILRQLGIEIEFAPHPVHTGITLDNLRTAVAGEVFEVDILYPSFVEQARQCHDVAVERTFTWALEAEKAHARLFNEALARMESEDEESWITLADGFYVCPGCGYTTEQQHEADRCGVCDCPRNRFGVIR
jgi:rubrerythrin